MELVDEEELTAVDHRCSRCPSVGTLGACSCQPSIRLILKEVGTGFETCLRLASHEVGLGRWKSWCYMQGCSFVSVGNYDYVGVEAVVVVQIRCLGNVVVVVDHFYTVFGVVEALEADGVVVVRNSLVGQDSRYLVVHCMVQMVADCWMPVFCFVRMAASNVMVLHQQNSPRSRHPLDCSAVLVAKATRVVFVG